MSKYLMYQRKNDSKIWKYVDLMYDENIIETWGAAKQW